MNVAIQVGLALLAVAGVFALVTGLRGRRIDDHPLCRACGFDLTGRPSGSDRCGECGAELDRPGAIRIGHRQRRGGLLALGVLLIIVGTTALGGQWIVRAQAVDLTPYKPFWWVRSELASDDGKVADAAWKELVRRAGASALSKGQANELADRALAVQADRATPWNATWGELIETLRSVGQLDDERWATYATQAFDVRMKVRPTVRQGDPVPVVLGVDSPRVKSARFTMHHRWAALGVGGVAVPKLPPAEELAFEVGPGSWGGSAYNPDVPGSVGQSLPLGATEVTATVAGRITEGKKDSPGVELRAVELPLRGTFDLVNADTPIE